MVNWSFFANYW